MLSALRVREISDTMLEKNKRDFITNNDLED